MAHDLSTFIITPSATLLEAARTIQAGMNRTVVVVEDVDSLKIIGILSEGDVLRALLKGADVRSPIKEFVKVSFTYFQEEDIEKARALFAEKGFGLIPIVDEDMHLTSVITLLDCLRSS